MPELAFAFTSREPIGVAFMTDSLGSSHCNVNGVMTEMWHTQRGVGWNFVKMLAAKHWREELYR